MDTARLKTFAQSARRQLLEDVSARLEQVLRADSLETREKAAAIADLRQQIANDGKAAVIDRVAYTWFNRLCALRFMDVNRYTRIGIVSPQQGFTQPEMLQEAKQGVIDEQLKVDRQRVLDILSGRLPSSDPQAEAYRLLLVGACNAYHAQMPFLFEPIEDYTELLMPDDLLSENAVLQRMRLVLTPEACQDVEVIGWLYQFYISERKDQVFEALKRNIKIEAKDIPAATQLFTPHWIVRYLVENSLGRLWMLNHPASKLVERMEYYIQPAQEETDFLRITSPEEIKLCDPACGSGHMLTYAFDLLHAIYTEQGYDAARIPSLILHNNLFGIEIDQRAGHLAAFALAMKARAVDRRFFTRGVEPNICVLRNVRLSAQEITDYMQVVGSDLLTQDLWETLKQFEQAENFGSLIRPALKDVAYVRARLEEKKVFENLFLHTTNQKVKQVLRQTEYLLPRYNIAVANPPYMGTANANEKLKRFAADLFPYSKSDLFAVFIERTFDLVKRHGYIGMITMQNWMFLSSFEKLREKILDENTILSMVHLGARAFDTISGEVVSTTSFVVTTKANPEFLGDYIRLVDGDNEAGKINKLQSAIIDQQCGWLFHVASIDFKKIPGSPIAYWVSEKIRDIFRTGTPFKIIGNPTVGMQTSNNAKFLRYWYEINFRELNHFNNFHPKWIKYLKGGPFRRWYGNLEFLLWYNYHPEFILEQPNATVLPESRLMTPKCTWTDITTGLFSCRLAPDDSFHDISGHCFYPPQKDQLWMLGYSNTKQFNYFLSLVNSSFHNQVGDIGKMPIIEVNTNQVTDIVKRLVEISQIDWNSHETAWDFSLTPILAISNNHTNLKELYIELRTQWKKTTLEAKSLEEKNNEVFIEGYNLNNEFLSTVPLEEVSLTCNPHYRFSEKKSKDELEALLLADTIEEFISYAVGCMFGRYSLDKPGLILANQGETLADYLRQVPEPSFVPDEDNVLPILAEDWFSNDIVERFKAFLRVTFGEEHYDENLVFIEDALGRDIRAYFLKDFYAEHLQMYKKRPIYWLFSSPNGSFNALIYLHRYQPDTVSVVLNDYLREYARKLTAHRAHLEQVSLRFGGSQAEKVKATKEINALNKVLVELKEYEDDVLYPLAARQVRIDLDDGVKVNYARFGRALKPVKGLGDQA